MIIAVGTDIVQIPRIESLLTKYSSSFINRILSEQEREQIKLLSIAKQAKFLAKRYAAKEAISKAFGTGIGQWLQFRNIVIFNDNLGKPIVMINSTNIADIHQFKIEVSMSDDYPIAVAFAILSI